MTIKLGKQFEDWHSNVSVPTFSIYLETLIITTESSINIGKIFKCDTLNKIVVLYSEKIVYYTNYTYLLNPDQYYLIFSARYITKKFFDDISVNNKIFNLSALSKYVAKYCLVRYT